MISCSSFVESADVPELGTTGWEYDHSLLISPLFLKLSLGLGQFSITYVCICAEWCLCVSVCVYVCGPPHCLIISGLSRGLSLGLPLLTVKFPPQTAQTMRTLPRLSTTSASPLAAIFRLQLQVYLCLRHPFISLLCCWEKAPWFCSWETVLTVECLASPTFPLVMTKTVRKVAKK